MRLALPVAALLLATLAAGCGDGGKAPCLEGAGTGAVEQDGGRPVAYLTGVAASAEGCADRVSFTFDGAAPGYRVRYLPGPQAKVEDASGRHLRIPGSAFLVVRLSPAQTARIDGDSVTRTYTGPRRLPAPEAHHVQEIVKTGDFEAVVTWAIGLDAARPFVVGRSGRTLVVDVG